MNDTIAAVSTALGVGAISIIRISGPDALNVVNKVLKNINLKNVPSHTIRYTHVYEDLDIIDEVLVSVMKAPRTFTKEDIVEINCHGGISATNKVLSLILANGARLAEPGEFTKRAFINGRIDLIEAEGIMDLINAKTDKMRKLALNQVKGKVSGLIKNLRKKIRDILINIDVNIDYPEYEDVLVVTKQMIVSSIIEIRIELNRILKEAENGKIIKEGIKTVIIGRPNVGKSSILNKLLEEDKAIVTNIPGTTRDIVEGQINLDGIILNIIDTAGIRATTDSIEQIGVNKSLKLLEKADLIIYVLNGNEGIFKEDLELLNQINDIKKIIFINKNDLKQNISDEQLKTEIIVHGNTINDNGLDELKNKIKEIFNIDEIEKDDLTYLSNARQIGILTETLTLVNELELSLENNVPIDILEIDLKKVWQLLGDIIGENYSDELLDELFKQFCLGK